MKYGFMSSTGFLTLPWRKATYIDKGKQAEFRIVCNGKKIAKTSIDRLSVVAQILLFSECSAENAAAANEIIDHDWKKNNREEC